MYGRYLVTCSFFTFLPMEIHALRSCFIIIFICLSERERISYWSVDYFISTCLYNYTIFFYIFRFLSFYEKWTPSHFTCLNTKLSRENSEEVWFIKKTNMIIEARKPSVDPTDAHPNIIEMHMLDLYKFFPTMACSSCAMRVIYYPFIKVTILQQQQKGSDFDFFL